MNGNNTELDEMVKETLEFVNDVRSKFNLEPLNKLEPGLASDSVNCPVSRSLIKNAGGSKIKYATTGPWRITIVYFDEGGHICWKDFDFNDAVRTFVLNVDTGLFPELIK